MSEPPIWEFQWIWVLHVFELRCPNNFWLMVVSPPQRPETSFSPLIVNVECVGARFLTLAKETFFSLITSFWEMNYFPCLPNVHLFRLFKISHHPPPQIQMQCLLRFKLTGFLKIGSGNVIVLPMQCGRWFHCIHWRVGGLMYCHPHCKLWRGKVGCSRRSSFWGPSGSNGFWHCTFSILQTFNSQSLLFCLAPTYNDYNYSKQIAHGNLVSWVVIVLRRHKNELLVLNNILNWLMFSMNINTDIGYHVILK